MADNEPLLFSCNWQLECVSSLGPPHKVLASPAVLQLRQLRARQAEAARRRNKATVATGSRVARTHSLHFVFGGIFHVQTTTSKRVFHVSQYMLLVSFHNHNKNK